MSVVTDYLKAVASSAFQGDSGLESWSFPDERGRCLVLFMQRLGDAVIASGFVNTLHKRYPEMPIDILGRPGLREVCATFTSFQEYFGIDLPFWGAHRKSYSDVMSALRTIRAIRRRKYSYCINLIGDIRENLVGRMTGARWRVAPVWSPGHPFAQLITPGNARWMTNCGIRIPAEYSSYYESMSVLARQLGMGDIEWPRHLARQQDGEKPVTVAIHPGSSHPSKQWGAAKWKNLIRDLDSRGYQTVFVGSPEERAFLLEEFSQEIRDCGSGVWTSDVSGLATFVSSVDALVGMDSFSAHVAHSVGVPAIVLHGSTEVGIMDPPDSIGLSAGHLCKFFPCHYKYPCKGTEGEYCCSRGIETSEVVDALLSVLNEDK
jgi:ADP-heptose:LPS heptosyltransferase